MRKHITAAITTVITIAVGALVESLFPPQSIVWYGVIIAGLWLLSLMYSPEFLAFVDKYIFRVGFLGLNVGRKEPERYKQPLKVTVFWDEQRHWRHDNLETICQDVVAWLKEKRDTHTTVDAYGTDWILSDPVSGLDIPRRTALFGGIDSRVRMPEKLQIRMLTQAIKQPGTTQSPHTQYTDAG